VPDKWAAVRDGRREVNRQARDTHREEATDPTVAKLHEWRNQAKYPRYQLEVLRPLWPQRLGELADAVDKMGELLGDDQGLAMLRQVLTADAGGFGDAGDREVLLALIDRRRAELQEVPDRRGEKEH
jgi:CHAD domain-containing protein